MFFARHLILCCAAVVWISHVDIALAVDSKSTPKSARVAQGAAKHAAPAAAAKLVPDLISEIYGDWVLRCEPTPQERKCELSQTIVIQGQQNPIAALAFGRHKANEPIHMVAQLPNNVTIAGGVKALLSDGETAADLQFIRCLPSGCFADAALSEAVLTKLKVQANPGKLKFRDGSEQEVALPFSFRGFDRALDALTRH